MLTGVRVLASATRIIIIVPRLWLACYGRYVARYESRREPSGVLGHDVAPAVVAGLGMLRFVRRFSLRWQHLE
jgi:hypothetical protein